MIRSSPDKRSGATNQPTPGTGVTSAQPVVDTDELLPVASGGPNMSGWASPIRGMRTTLDTSLRVGVRSRPRVFSDWVTVVPTAKPVAEKR